LRRKKLDKQMESGATREVLVVGFFQLGKRTEIITQVK
jgi:hypothetical protein